MVRCLLFTFVFLAALLWVNIPGELSGTAVRINDAPRPGVLPKLDPERKLPKPEARGRRPNIVMIMTDDQVVGDLEFMQHTQRLIGAEGVRFDKSYVSYPTCCPSRATYLTGQYAHNNGVMGLYPPLGGVGRLKAANTLPVWLDKSGYTTAHMGKYLNGYGSQQPATVPPGWDEWYGLVDPTTYRMWGYQLNENGVIRQYGKRFDEDPRLYQTDVLRDKALNFIDRRAPRKRPFFLSMAFVAPHHEWDGIRNVTGKNLRPAPRHAGVFASKSLPRPENFNEASVLDKPHLLRRGQLQPERVRRLTANYQRRIESLLAVDEAVRDIAERLRANQELGHTLIIFTSDNGFFQGEHRRAYGKTLAYDPASRVPLLMRGPGISPGSASQQLVGNIDLAPTILDIAKARAGLALDGQSMLPAARKKVSPRPRLFLHETGPRTFIPVKEQDSGTAPVIRKEPAYTAVRTGRYLFIKYKSGGEELYDRRRDPQELHSQHANPAYIFIKLALQKSLRRLTSCRGAICRDMPVDSVLTQDLRSQRFNRSQ